MRLGQGYEVHSCSNTACFITYVPKLCLSPLPFFSLRLKYITEAIIYKLIIGLKIAYVWDVTPCSFVESYFSEDSATRISGAGVWKEYFTLKPC